MGLGPPFSCREGRCSSCACRLVEGEVRMIANNALEAEDLAENLILACQSMSVSSAVSIEFE
ncbi:2Fe-2S iron-sulfur cluster-binding protein [Pseudonocardia sp. Cha107L01]|uniref:2Fe-2S iron-sulfur cluster-binding protein n=1 Tax=Pseudonocardia sp. Cha107L01 TaxID=3457576 RepID=UPI00403EA198